MRPKAAESHQRDLMLTEHSVIYAQLVTASEGDKAEARFHAHRICGRVKLICNFFMAVWALQVQGRLALAGGRPSEGARWTLWLGRRAICYGA
jgi:hypothetical protein